MKIKLFDEDERERGMNVSDITCTVAELIEGLKKCNPNAKVITEGCDCIGSATALDADDNEVMIER
jgi:hypothetical protein